jgi:hypothetical protein
MQTLFFLIKFLFVFQKLRNSEIKSFRTESKALPTLLIRGHDFWNTISYPTAIILAKKNDHVVAIPPNK